MAGIKGQMKYKRGDMVGVYEFIDRIKRPHGYRYMLHCTVCGTTKIVSSSIVSMRATANRCTCREHYTSRPHSQIENLCCNCKNFTDRRDGKPSLMCWRYFLSNFLKAPFMHHTDIVPAGLREVMLVYECDKFEEE